LSPGLLRNDGLVVVLRLFVCCHTASTRKARSPCGASQQIWLDSGRPEDKLPDPRRTTAPALSSILRGPLRGHLRVMDKNWPPQDDGQDCFFSRRVFCSRPSFVRATGKNGLQTGNSAPFRFGGVAGSKRRSKGSGTPAGAVVQPPHQRMRRAPKNGARTPTGVPPRHSRQRPNATAQLQHALPGTKASSGVTRI
jgi:hypothetical protein